MRAAVLRVLVTVWVAGLAVSPAFAQYFGQNKVQYRNFHYEVLKTDHFDIYFYPDERPAVEQAARMAERWYARYSRIFIHKLTGRQPLILYADQPDFQQTNAIQGDIGEGTGGVTELLKRRIVLPMELRRTLGINVKDPIAIYVEGDRIILEKHRDTCVLCGDTADVSEFKGRPVCAACVEEIRHTT